MPSPSPVTSANGNSPRSCNRRRATNITACRSAPTPIRKPCKSLRKASKARASKRSSSTDVRIPLAGLAASSFSKKFHLSPDCLRHHRRGARAVFHLAVFSRLRVDQHWAVADDDFRGEIANRFFLRICSRNRVRVRFRFVDCGSPGGSRRNVASRRLGRALAHRDDLGTSHRRLYVDGTSNFSSRRGGGLRRRSLRLGRLGVRSRALARNQLSVEFAWLFSGRKSCFVAANFDYWNLRFVVRDGGIQFAARDRKSV